MLADAKLEVREMAATTLSGELAPAGRVQVGTPTVDRLCLLPRLLGLRGSGAARHPLPLALVL
jgi:hypothetical protein